MMSSCRMCLFIVSSKMAPAVCCPWQPTDSGVLKLPVRDDIREVNALNLTHECASALTLVCNI